MESYIPATWVRVAILADVVGLAFFRGVQEDDGTFLVTGGDDPQAVFITGPRLGKSVRAKNGSSRAGTVIDGVDIRVDLASAFRPDRTGHREGSFALVGADRYVVAGTRADFGFDDTFGWNLATGEGVEYLSGGIAYARWRICKSDGDAVVTLADVTAAEPKR